MTRRELLISGAACASTLWARSHWDRTRISAITDEVANSPDAAVDFAHEFGLQAVEIRNLPGTSKEYALGREPDIQADAAHLENERIKVSCVDTSLLKFAWPGTQPVTPVAEEPAQREKRMAAETARWERRMEDLRKALRCAQIAGADKLRIFAGLRVADPAAILPRTVATIGEMAVEAEKQKITLLVSNDPATNIATCAELAAVLKLLPSRWVAIDWNPHASAHLEKPFPAGYALLPKKRILNVRAQAASLAPGVEAEDWKAILQALDHDGYSGRIALATDAVDNARIAIARASIEQLAHIVREVS